MAARTYLALLDRAGDGSWGVRFPDLPGCVSAGDSIAEAAAAAREALALHLLGLHEDGAAIPAPREPDATKPARGEVLIAVPAELPGSLERVNITIDRALLEAADARAGEAGMTRSGYLAQLVREALTQRRGRARAPARLPRQAATGRFAAARAPKARPGAKGHAGRTAG